MIDVRAIIEKMQRDEAFYKVVNNPASQFGTPERPLLGATILPEVTKRDLSYDEAGIRYRTVVANDGTRYSPVQKKRGVLIGHFHVQLGHQDAGSEFTAADYDGFIRLLSLSSATSDQYSMQAMAQLMQWSDRTLNMPLREKIEVARWEAIIGAQVNRRGDNGYTEAVPISNPAGSRVNVGGTWSDDTYDPYLDIINVVDYLKTKGYTVTRIVSGLQAIQKLLINAKVRQRLGYISVASGTVVGLAGRVQLGDFNNYIAGDGLPPIERYDLQYLTDTGSQYFLPRDAMVFFCETGLDTQIDLADAQPIIVTNTIGYVGVGPAAGQVDPGRVSFVNPFLTTKPPRIEGEAWQTSFPVITLPESIAVLRGIA